jgi:ribosome-binding factor A
VTAVETTRDMRHATVFVSIMGTDAERAATLEGLSSLAAHLRGRIGRALRLRVAPELEFRIDESVQRAARIDALLNQVRDGAVAPDDGDV